MNDKKYIKTAKSSGLDVLSDVLYLLKLDVDIYHNAKVCGDWRIDEHKLGATCFHIITLGQCVMHIPNAETVVLTHGDLVIFPRELTHHILPMESLTGEQQHLSFSEAQSIPGTGLLCGEVIFKHRGSRLLLDQFPSFFIIKNSSDNVWLKAILDMIIIENTNNQAASRLIINRLSELLFTYAIRQQLNDNPDNSGMLRIYNHSRLSKAIECIHKNPEKNWTLENLAKIAGLSRTLFAENFKAVCGWTPGQYLVWWRMQIAWSLLSKGEMVSQVAEQVGYHSESSFSRAFSKMFSITAGKVRRNGMQRDTTATQNMDAL
ncbi:MAG: AraC family transcriptional regulator [Ectothiorhodospiraceae bacterium]|nr:AraC family transcriptional regulator [Ectothiorhodospiraceae bacterium]